MSGIHVRERELAQALAALLHARETAHAAHTQRSTAAASAR